MTIVMHAFQLLLSGLVLLQPPAVPTGTAPAGSDVAGQSEQVRQVLTRLDRANRIVLGPDEVAVERARAIVLLRQVGQGKRISQAELDRLLQATGERERAAIELLARQFRIKVYRTFRQRRSTVTLRRAALAQVLASWESAGGQFDEQDRLIDWLELAIRNSMPGSVGPLPEAPIFALPDVEAETPSFEPLVSWEPPKWTTPSETSPSTAPAERYRRVAALRQTPQPGAVAVDSVPPRPVAATALLARRSVSDGRLPDVLPLGRPISPPGRRSGVAATVVERPRAAQALPVILPPSTPQRPHVAFPTRSAQRDGSVTTKRATIEQPATTAPIPDRPTSVAALRRPANGEPTIIGRRPVRPPARRLDANVSPSPPLPPVMEDPFADSATPQSAATPQLPDSLAMIGQRNDRTMPAFYQPPSVPVTGPPVPPNSPPAPPQRPRASTGSSDPAPPTPADLPERVALLPLAVASLPDVRPAVPRELASAVRVNLDELKVRIAGTNLALRALEDDVDEDRRWTAAHLEPLVERLGSLIERRGDLSMFLDLLGPRDRSKVGQLDSPRLAVSQLAERIVDARTHVTADHFPNTAAQRRRELARLDRLSIALAEMVVER